MLPDLRNMTTGEADAFRAGWEAAKRRASQICAAEYARRHAEALTATTEDAPRCAAKAGMAAGLSFAILHMQPEAGDAQP